MSEYRDFGRDIRLLLLISIIIISASIFYTILFPKYIHDFILVYWWIILIFAIMGVGIIMGITTDPSGKEEYIYVGYNPQRFTHGYQRYFPELSAACAYIFAIIFFIVGLYLLSLGFMARSEYDINRNSIISAGITCVILGTLCIDSIIAIRMGYKL